MILLSPEEIFSKLSVDTETGRVTWIKAPRTHPRMQGQEAGSMRPTQAGKFYCVIKIRKIAVKRGHIVFLAKHGHWPSPCLDHINGDSTDDRSCNLREATVQQNAMNHKKRAKRSALPMGIRILGGRFQARIGFNKKQIHLGCFDTLEEARQVYLSQRKELFGEYA